MIIPKHVGTRGVLLTFDDGISVYLIQGSEQIILCDTHLGPDSMEEVFSYLRKKPEKSTIIIFNSHSDWDHIWGNCSFPGSIIIGHETCRKRMINRGRFDLMQNSSLQRGRVILCAPNLTFSDRLVLEEEGIEFQYAPGHTSDSAVCYDSMDNILYIGDMAEDPIPYLDAEDLDLYLETMKTIYNHQADILISAHSGMVSRDLILRNISYILSIRDGKGMNSEEFGQYTSVHQWNLNMRLIWKYLRKRADVSDPDPELVQILEHIGDLHVVTQEQVSEFLVNTENLVNRAKKG